MCVLCDDCIDYRLNGLALMSCHREVEIPTHKVIDELWQKNGFIGFVVICLQKTSKYYNNYYVLKKQFKNNENNF